MSQPSDQELLQLCLSGELPGDLRALAEALGPGPADGHSLAGRVRAAMDFAGLIESLPLEAVPPAVRRAARRANRDGTGFRVWLASLWTPPTQLVPAFRGATAAPETYHAGPFELDLLRTSSGALIGELVPREADQALPSAGSCSLFGPTGVTTVELGPMGDFRFDDAQEGNYRLVLELVLELEPATIVLADLTI